MEQKAIFLGVTKIHSTKNNRDYRKADFFVPPYQTKEGYTRGGVMTTFIDVESKLGDDIKIGSIVIPEYEYDPCAQRAELVDIKLVKPTPYKLEDFN